MTAAAIPVAEPVASTDSAAEGQEPAGAAVRGVAWLGGERWINQIVVAAVFVALGRLVSPVDFGVIAAAGVITAFLRVLVDGGFSRALIQLPVVEDIDVDTAFWTSLGIGILLTLITIAVSPLLAALFGEPRLRDVVIAVSPIFILVAFESSQSALVDRAMQFRVQAIRRSVSTVVSSAVAIAIAAAGGGVWALVAQTMIYESLLVILLWSLADWRPKMRWSRERLRYLVNFGVGMTGIRTMFYLAGNADNFLIGVALGPLALGLYTIAYRVMIVMSDVTGTTLGRVSAPLFARFQDDRERLAGAFVDSCQLGCLVALPLFAPLAVLGDIAVPTLFGPHWHAAGPIAQVLALAGAGQVLSGQLHNVVIATNRVSNELRWTTIAVLGLVAAFIVTVNFGTVWVALSVGVTILGLVPLRLWLVIRAGVMPASVQRRFYSAISGAFVAAALDLGVMFAVKQVFHAGSGLTVIFPVGLSGAATYVFALRLLAPGSWDMLMRTAGRLRPAT